MFCNDGCDWLTVGRATIVSIVNAPTPPLLIYLLSDGYPIQKLEMPNLKYPKKPKRGGLIPNCFQSLSGAMSDSGKYSVSRSGPTLCCKLFAKANTENKVAVGKESGNKTKEKMNIQMKRYKVVTRWHNIYKQS